MLTGAWLDSSVFFGKIFRRIMFFFLEEIGRFAAEIFLEEFAKISYFFRRIHYFSRKFDIFLVLLEKFTFRKPSYFFRKP